MSTSTDDADGEVVAERSPDGVTGDAVRAGLAGLVGEIDQVPSSVSAVKVAGRRAYERVRAGERVELPARRVRVDSIEVTRLEPPDVDVSLRCSSGTYVRAIARDLGEVLRVGAHLTALRRTAVGPFDLSRARTLDELADAFAVIPLGDAARECFPACDLSGPQAADVRVGRRLALRLPQAGPVAVFAPDGEFLALYEQRGEQAAAVAVFAAQ